VQAAVLLAARSLCRHFALPHPSADEILAATGASKSRAYELCAALMALLPTLSRPCGRPAQPNVVPPASPADRCTADVLDFVLRHPGCAYQRDQRQGFSDEFRHFIVRLREQHSDLALDVFSRLCRIPLGTIKSWMAQSRPAVSSADATCAADASAQHQGAHGVMDAQIESILAEWRSWRGTFGDFTKHVNHQLRVPMGRHLLAQILEVHGVRLPRKRQGRSPDELALRRAFETFFPGAQWVGDGKQVRVVIGDDVFVLNLQLNVDAHTGAFVGLSVTDTEDSAAVIESFENGIVTTGAPPLAELLDNKPSNHTAEVDAVLKPAGTLRIRATSERPQNKAHVEGAFGLFAQEVPPIVLDTNASNRSVARALLLLVSMTFARAINHRPRADRAGRSRFDLYSELPAEEQVAQARHTLEERCKKQELARLTKDARQRPEIKVLLDDHFARLGLIDPERHIRMAIARYPLDAIVDGIAIFTGKLHAGTLPEDVDARYLLGIVRNVATQCEGERIAEALLAQRIEARDRALASLETKRAAVCEPSRSTRDVIADCVEHALGADRKLDRLFWLGTLVGAVQERAATSEQRNTHFAAAARDINTTYRVPPRERQSAVRFIADRLVALD
jgi:hypothetical protein